MQKDLEPCTFQLEVIQRSYQLTPIKGYTPDRALSTPYVPSPPAEPPPPPPNKNSSLPRPSSWQVNAKQAYVQYYKSVKMS